LSQQNTIYERMLHFVNDAVHGAEDNLSIKIHYLIDKVKEQAYELGEFSREEIDKVSDYLQRDIQDAAEYLSKEGTELRDWLKFDTELVEDRLLDLFSSAINTTNIELDELSRKAQQENLWYKDETTGPGSFICEQCGQQIKILKIQSLSQCSECGGEIFKRVSA